MDFVKLVSVILVFLCWGGITGCADHPENLSLFDPDLFTVQEPLFSVNENMTVVENLLFASGDEISGTGTLYDSIRVDGTAGEYSISTIEIEGTGETTWSYTPVINNKTSPYSTAIILEVRNASSLWLTTVGVTGTGDTANSFAEYEDDVSGTFQYGSLIPSDSSSAYLPGPESHFIVQGVTGDGYIIDQAFRLSGEMGASAINDLNLVLEEPEIAETGNATIQNGFAGYDQYARVVMRHVGTVGNRIGVAFSSPDEAYAHQFLQDGTGSRLQMNLVGGSSDNPEGYESYHTIRGYGVTQSSYLGRVSNHGTQSQMSADYEVLSVHDISRQYYGSASDTPQYISDVLDVLGPSAELSGTEDLVTEGQTISLDGQYEIRGQNAGHESEARGGESWGKCSLNGGEEDGAPLSLKGYIRNRASLVNTGLVSLQNLFYADASRGTSLSWGTKAFRSSEDVEYSGTSNSGPGFIRQNAYSDRSTLTAS